MHNCKHAANERAQGRSASYRWYTCGMGFDPAERCPTPASAEHDAQPFQVLALDGGGVRGIFTAALLAGLEEDTGRPVLDHFDLLVGTSTGGIVALGLGAGLTPRQILDFYLSENRRIFANRLRWRVLRHPFVAKYRAKHLQAALQQTFGETLLGDSAVPLVIPSFNLGENDVYLFKTPHHERLKRDYRVPMWAVAMATSAAPTYFPVFRLPGDHVRLIDGGVWANNPAMVGVTEAVSMFGQRLADVRVLSVGTTSTLKLGRSRLNNAGIVGWGPNAVDVFLDGQSAGAFAQVQHLIGADHAHRLNPPAPQELASLDACDARELIAKAAHHSRQFSPTFDAVFGSHVRSPYTPLCGQNAKEGAHVVAHH
jgi:predicted acylesterase/phospholipase RssA